jgi:hypothetical protein
MAIITASSRPIVFECQCSMLVMSQTESELVMERSKSDRRRWPPKRCPVPRPKRHVWRNTPDFPSHAPLTRTPYP